MHCFRERELIVRLQTADDLSPDLVLIATEKGKSHFEQQSERKTNLNLIQQIIAVWLFIIWCLWIALGDR
jgi:hypothetical protein